MMISAQSPEHLWGAYCYLRDRDLTAVSTTSRLLQEGNVAYLQGRLCDEVTELSGVLRGEHHHVGLSHDIITEGSQVCYWLFLVALSAGVTYSQLQPTHHLFASPATNTPLSPDGVAMALTDSVSMIAEAEGAILLEGLQQVLRLVGWSCRAAGVEPLALIEDDLYQMQQCDYLAPYFAANF